MPRSNNNRVCQTRKQADSYPQFNKLSGWFREINFQPNLVNMTVIDKTKIIITITRLL